MKSSSTVLLGVLDSLTSLALAFLSPNVDDWRFPNIASVQPVY